MPLPMRLTAVLLAVSSCSAEWWIGWSELPLATRAGETAATTVGPLTGCADAGDAALGPLELVALRACAESLEMNIMAEICARRELT
jgi:hypothetical protein